MSIRHLLLFFCFASYSAGAQKVYNLSSVPESLKANAAIITHFENIHLEVESLEKSILKVEKIFTVINEDGKDALFFNEYSTKFISLTDAEVKIFDHNGKQLKKYTKKDMMTVAIGEGLVEDGFVTYFKITPPSYPVTIQVNYEQKFKGSLFLPDYRFINKKEAVVESSYTAKVPTDFALRYKSKNISLIPEISDQGKYKLYKWSVKNLAAIDDEEGSVSPRDKFPYVNIVANQFSHYGYKGDLSTWKSFGSWIQGLYEGADVLSQEREQFFRNLVQDAKDENEKVARIYKFLQDNFRYVSIQLGIGGLKPFSAAFTDQNKYGDCKALSNYMKSALKAVGIKSHVAIINADANQQPVDPDFPANNFNHVILCVPGPKDSIWLECTSRTAEFGRLGTFTENRNALLITEDGGVLVATPKSHSSYNQFSTYNTVQMDNDLSAVTETVMTTNGAFSEMMADIVKGKKDDQKETIVHFLGYKQPQDFEISANGGGNHKSHLKMSIRKLPEFNSGSKYFIKPRINTISAIKLPSAENRKMDFYFRYPFEKRDTTVIKLTEGFKVDVLPKDKELSNKFGYYSSKSWYNESQNAIYTTTTLVLLQHKIPAADYRSVKAFFDEVAQGDADRIVVKKTETGEVPKKVL